MYEADVIFIVVIGGYIIFETTDADGDFICTIYSGSFLFFSLLREAKISDLVLGNMNWKLSDLAVSGNWNEWALIDLHTEMPNDYINDNPPASEGSMIFNFRRLYPGKFLSDIIDAILTYHGYTIGNPTGEAWTDTNYIKAYLPCITQKGSDITGTQMTDCECIKNVAVIYPIQSVLSSQQQWFFDKVIYVHNFENIMYVADVNTQTDVLHVKIWSPGTYGFHARILLEWNAGAPGVVQRLAWGISTSDGITLIGETFTIDESAGSGWLEINQNGIYVSEYSELRIHIYDAAWPAGREIWNMDGYFKIVNADPDFTTPGYDFDTALNLPDLTHSQVVKLWLQMTGAMLTVNEEEKKVYVYQLKELYSATPEDWSDYFCGIDEVQYHPDGIYQSNLLKYTNDEFVSSETLGEHSQAVSDQAIEPEGDLITLELSATDDVLHGNDSLKVGGMPMAKIKIHVAGVPTNEVTGRLLLATQETVATLPVQIIDTAFAVTQTDVWIAKFDGLAWADLRQEYYDEYFERILANFRLVRAKMLLPPDIV